MHQRYFPTPFFQLLLTCLCLFSTAHAKTPDILVSIKPIHSLTQAITANINDPQLLIQGFQTPHDYYLKPSDRRKISQADIIIFASENIESFLPAINRQSKPNQHIINLSHIKGIQLLEARSQDEQHDHGHHSIDGHIWLSVSNAQIIVRYLADYFAQLDPDHAAQYDANAKTLLLKLEQLKIQTQGQLNSQLTPRYLMFHDAFQYFEHEFQLKQARYVTTSPENISGVRRIQSLKQHIQQNNIRCIFYEPPVVPSIIHTLVGHQAIKILALDPIGSQLDAGPQLYFTLIEEIASSLYRCMEK
ncbi:MAG: zinc ABC transporter substrate-binding protein [Gammaproteobacteria bacterium]|nr:zinc ABC transporter substrate-binding protein [Gammaproteobacteria bacterium]